MHRELTCRAPVASTRIPRALIAIAAAILVVATGSPASAAAVFTGGNGAVSFGVADYGGPPNNVAPTYIPNNFTGLVDVLTSPAGGFLTADTSIPNNLASFAGNLPGGAVWFGGSNINGTFGAGSVGISGPAIGFALADANPDGGGAASYLIGSWNANFTFNADFNDTYGSYLAVSGQLTTPLSAGAFALRTRITGGPFGAGVDLPELVLAAAGNGNFQALGGPLGLNAALVIFPNGTFSGLAINNLGPIAIADGTAITVTSTLTAIADPAMTFSIFEIDPDLLALTGTTLPAFVAAQTYLLPEPASAFMLALMTAALSRRRARSDRAEC